LKNIEKEQYITYNTHKVHKKTQNKNARARLQPGPKQMRKENANMQKMKKQNGITLIALIITIIVMLILVGVTVTVALNGGLFTTAKDAVDQTQIAAEREQLLSAAIGEIGDNGKVELEELDKNLPEGFEKVAETDTTRTYQSEKGNKYKVDENGNITLLGEEAGGGNEGGSGEVEVPELETIVATTPGIVFKKGGETEVTGEALASVVLESGDTVEYGDYIYTYGNYPLSSDDAMGWKVVVTDTTKTSYMKIASTILGYPLLSMVSTFEGCTLLQVAPEIPEGVEELGNASMGYTGAFCGCTSLTVAPQIPSSVIRLSGAFADCTSLETVTAVPSNVIAMYGAFYNCTALTGTIQINTNKLNDNSQSIVAPGYNQCFGGTVLPITLTGESDYLDELAATSTSGNVTVGTTNDGND